MKACAVTDTGRVRPVNQDFLYASTEPVGPLANLFIVADGMGGHQAGDFASRYLVGHLVKHIESSSLAAEQPVPVLRQAIEDVNTELFELACAKPDLAGMGSTLVAATVAGGVLYVANVGDSRLYTIRGTGIRQITRDHSFVEEMVSRGQMGRGSRAYKEQKNIITRAMGIGRKIRIDFFEEPLSGGEYLLLCSDGLTNMVDNSAIFRLVLMPETLQMKAKALIALANQNGGRDNIAVILVDPQISEVRER